MKKQLNHDATKRPGTALTLEKLQERPNNNDLRDDELGSTAPARRPTIRQQVQRRRSDAAVETVPTCAHALRGSAAPSP